MSKNSDNKLDMREIDDIVEREFSNKELEKHIFSDQYNQKKNSILNSVNTDTKKGFFYRYRYAKIMVPAAGLLVAFTTTAYAIDGFKKFSFNEKKTGDYKVDVVIEKGDDVSKKGQLIEGVDASENLDFDTPNGHVIYDKAMGWELIGGIPIPDQDRYLKINLGYLPDGTVVDSSVLVNKYHSAAGNFDIGIYDMRDADNEMKLENFKVTSVNKIIVSGHEAIFTEADNILYDVLKDDYSGGGEYTKNMYIYFGEFDTMLHINAAADLNNEEIRKIADNITLSAGDRYDCMYFGDWEMFDRYRPSTANSYNDPYHCYEIDAEKVKMYEVGESYESPADTLKQGIGGVGFTYVVKDVQVIDNLRNIKNYDSGKMIEEIENDEDYKKFIDKDGNLLQDRLLYVKEGDGIFTLDSVVDDKSVNLKFLFAEIDVTNNSEYDIEDTIICTDITSVKEENGIVKLVKNSGYGITKPNEKYDYIFNSAYMLTGNEVLFNDAFTGYENRINLKSGETKTMHVLFCVDENELEVSCLNTSITGDGSVAFDNDSNSIKYVKLVK